MSILGALSKQKTRVENAQAGHQAELLNDAATPAATAASEVIKGLQRLQVLMQLPSEFGGAASQSWQNSLSRIRKALAVWEGIEERPSLDGVSSLATELQQFAAVLTPMIESIQQGARSAVDVYRQSIGDSEFLAQQLGVDSANAASSRSEIVEVLALVEQLVNGGTVSGLDAKWQVAKLAFDREASAQSCLKRAHLPQIVGELVESLLTKGEVPLEAIETSTLRQLMESPALARMVRLTLPRTSAP